MVKEISGQNFKGEDPVLLFFNGGSEEVDVSLGTVPESVIQPKSEALL